MMLQGPSLLCNPNPIELTPFPPEAQLTATKVKLILRKKRQVLVRFQQDNSHLRHR
jgi:hypothetical protein